MSSIDSVGQQLSNFYYRQSCGGGGWLKAQGLDSGHLLAMVTQASHLSFLYLSFFIYKMGILSVRCQGGAQVGKRPVGYVKDQHNFHHIGWVNAMARKASRSLTLALSSSTILKLLGPPPHPSPSNLCSLLSKGLSLSVSPKLTLP